MNKYKENVVTPSFRLTILKNYPELKENIALFRMLDYLLFGTFFDEGTCNLVLSYDQCRRFKGGSQKTKNFSASKLVEEFSDKVFKVNLSKASARAGKATQVVSMEMPLWLTNLRSSFFDSDLSEGLVGLVSGKPVNLELEHAARVAAVEEVPYRAKAAEAGELICYLNQLPADLFQPVRDAWPNAVRAARQLTDPKKRDQQLAVLHHIRFNPQPLYAPVDRSARIYAVGPSFLTVKSELRLEITGSWARLDIKQAQLNIISKLWGQPKIREYLESLDVSLWADLIKRCEVDDTDQNRAVIKKVLYALVFGMHRGNAQKLLVKSLGRNAAKAFFSHPIIARVMAARDLEVADIRAGHIRPDAFGNVSKPIVESDESEAYLHAISILACEAQSYELPLLIPVVHLAQTTEGTADPVYVVGWLHDGIYLWSSNPTRLENFLGEAQELIRNKSASMLGFEMDVEVSLPADTS